VGLEGPAFSAKAQRSQGFFYLFVQSTHRAAGVVDADPNDPGQAMIGKTAGCADLELEGLKLGTDVAAKATDVGGSAVGDVAEKFHGQVDVLGLDPADVGADFIQAVLQTQQLALDWFVKVQGQKNTQ
jgi:hypothetical protein